MVTLAIARHHGLTVASTCPRAACGPLGPRLKELGRGAAGGRPLTAAASGTAAGSHAQRRLARPRGPALRVVALAQDGAAAASWGPASIDSSRAGSAWGGVGDSLRERLAPLLAPLLLYKELLRRVAVTLGVMLLLRLGCFVPLPNVVRPAMGHMVAGSGNPYGTLFHLGIMPYIIVQVFAALGEANKVPFLVRLREEGVEGYWALLRLCNIFGALFAVAQGVFDAYGFLDMPGVVMTSARFFVLPTALTMAAGSVVMNYAANCIDVSGIGDGISLALCMNIVAGYGDLMAAVHQYVVANSTPAWMLGGAAVWYGLLVAAMVAINNTQLRVPMVYYKRRSTRGMSNSPLASLADRSSNMDAAEAATAYIPLRLTRGLSSLLFASYGCELVQMLGKLFSESAVLRWQQSPSYLAFFAVVVFLMEFTGPNWSHAEAIADYLTKIEAGIDGVSPGQATRQYLRAKERVCRLWGGLALTAVLLAAQAADRLCFGPLNALPGTSLLLIVSLVASASRQVKSLTLAPRIERRLLQQRRALQSMVNTVPGMEGPGL